jgi:bifunctional DNA-binding transcriptional regulator/antitoxin component of YhaV-PrlF toxin-antitoxin module
MEIIQTDALGNLCIPENISHALGLKPGIKFRIQTKGNMIILTKLDHPEDQYEDILLDDLLQGDENDTLEEWSQLQVSTINNHS